LEESGVHQIIGVLNVDLMAVVLMIVHMSFSSLLHRMSCECKANQNNKKTCCMPAHPRVPSEWSF
jgi:hypothetical protein